MLLTLTRSLAFSWRHFWRNVWLSLATVTVVTLMLFAVMTTLFFQLVADTVISSVQDKIDVSVYVKADVSQAEIVELRDALEDLPAVASVTVVSPEEALASFRERHADDALILQSLDALEENPLTTSLIVKTSDPDTYPTVLDTLDETQYARLIEEKDYEDNQLLIQRIIYLSTQARRAGVLLVAVFGVIAFLVVFNTLRVAIYTYREEIGIMKLVGATNAFVRLPFFLEQIWYGLLSSVIASVAFVGVVYAVAPRLADFIGRDDVLQLLTSRLPIWFGIEAGAAIVLCVLSGAFAIRRYLRV